MSLDRVLQPLVACVGNPVGGNPTQYVMSRLAREAELDWRFFTSQVSEDSLQSAFRGIQALGMAGAAILPPFQMAVQPFLDSLTPRAQALGRVHVVKGEQGTEGGTDRWVGDETLTTAILRALTHRFYKQVSQGELDSENSFSPQTLVVIGDQKLADSLRLGLIDIPGDYQVVCFEELMNPQGSSCHSEPDPSSSRREGTPHDGVPNQAHPLEATSIEESRDGVEFGRQRPVRALIIESIDAMMNAPSHARNRFLKELVWTPHPVGLLVPPAKGWLEDSLLHSEELEVLEQFSLDWIDELDVMVHQAAVNFEFWTGYEPELEGIRESLEEYLQW